jgi:hypothetical protein
MFPARGCQHSMKTLTLLAVTGVACAAIQAFGQQNPPPASGNAGPSGRVGYTVLLIPSPHVPDGKAVYSTNIVAVIPSTNLDAFPILTPTGTNTSNGNATRAGDLKTNKANQE